MNFPDFLRCIPSHPNQRYKYKGQYHIRLLHKNNSMCIIFVCPLFDLLASNAKATRVPVWPRGHMIQWPNAYVVKYLRLKGLKVTRSLLIRSLDDKIIMF